jgi:hypothetical protein
VRGGTGRGKAAGDIERDGQMPFAELTKRQKNGYDGHVSAFVEK